jgi:adenylylsulfate kinase
LARLFNDAGLIVIAALISPYVADRQLASEIVGDERFVEVFVDAPLEVCERRDPKGLYAKARAGQIGDFTGISAPYEAPKSPPLRLDTHRLAAEQSVQILSEYLTARYLDEG